VLRGMCTSPVVRYLADARFRGSLGLSHTGAANKPRRDRGSAEEAWESGD